MVNKQSQIVTITNVIDHYFTQNLKHDFQVALYAPLHFALFVSAKHENYLIFIMIIASIIRMIFEINSNFILY